MRIVTWNCYRGECHRRAAKLLPLRPDLIALQECARPTATNGDDHCVCFGSNPKKGVAAVSFGDWHVQPGPLDPDLPHSVYPVRVFGPSCFHMLVVWAQRSPTYVRAVMKGLDTYADFVRAAPCIVIGDFNSHWIWDRRDGKTNHSALVERMKKEFGLVSALHATAPPNTPEPPTQYWRWKKEHPYHLDYAFIPAEWLPRLHSIEIGSYEEWADESDHCPLFVDFGVKPLT